ncbi:MAG TPA: TetR/AcrR family transcriptional regulator [Pseudonocardia sp.]|jgi:AcrR family transcriptional regulator
MADPPRARVDARPRGRPRTGVREAILAAATEILVDEGVGRLSTVDVALRAGTAESSIFYHFKDRVGLLVAVIEGESARYGDLTRQVRERVGQGSVRDGLVTVLDVLEEFFLRILPIVAAMLADGRIRTDLASRGTEVDGGPGRAMALLIPYLADEQRAGRVRADCDLTTAALLLVGAAYQRALHRRLTGDGSLPGHEQVVALLAPAVEP